MRETGPKKAKYFLSSNILECLICKQCFKAKNLFFHYKNEHSVDDLAHVIINLQESLLSSSSNQKSDESLKTYDFDHLPEESIEQNDGDDEELTNNSIPERVDLKDVRRKPKPASASFQCDICGKCLSSKGNLTKHKILHKKEKPFSCELCKVDYNQGRDLKNHMMRVHTGERPHKCKVCQKGFIHKSYLKEHMDYHSESRKWHCPHCKKQFQSSKNLSVHMKRHSKERSHRCHLCNKSFTVQVDLSSHLRLTHKTAG